MKMGRAEASKKRRKINKFVHAKLPTKQISEIRMRVENNSLLTTEYHAVSSATIKTAVLNITNGKFKPWYSSNQELAGYITKPSFEYCG